MTGLLRLLAILWLAWSCTSGWARSDHNDWISPGALPREARQTLQHIQEGGPFPYDKDGSVFGNYERRLPIRPRGYYREYTVDTPGSRGRGARRIITGGRPPVEYFYTDDHYRSFRRLQEAP